MLYLLSNQTNNIMKKKFAVPYFYKSPDEDDATADVMIVEGDTLEEALQNAKEALEADELEDMSEGDLEMGMGPTDVWIYNEETLEEGYEIGRGIEII